MPPWGLGARNIQTRKRARNQRPTVLHISLITWWTATSDRILDCFVQHVNTQHVWVRISIHVGPIVEFPAKSIKRQDYQMQCWSNSHKNTENNAETSHTRTQKQNCCERISSKRVIQGWNPQNNRRGDNETTLKEQRRDNASTRHCPWSCGILKIIALRKVAILS